MKIINCEGLILGRLATYAAKEANVGEEVILVNCSKALITGKKEVVLKFIHHKLVERGNVFKGPFISCEPAAYVRRVIRGMFPWRMPRGREAYSRIKCYSHLPEDLKDAKFEKLDFASIRKVPNLKYIQIGEILRLMGAKQ